MARHRRQHTPDALEDEACEAELGVAPGTALHGAASDAAALSGVRLHRDDAAAELTSAVGAQAVTMGAHVYLSPKVPPRAAPACQRLLLHELTRVVTSMLTLRYLMTARAGLIDMRHFLQVLYISWFVNTGQSDMAKRGATAQGIGHEETSEAASKQGPEDLTSNALGAWTATRGPGQRGRLKTLLGLS